MAIKQIIVVRDDLKIGKGKLCAHVAHASLAGYKLVKKKKESVVEEWEDAGEKKIVVRVKDEKELLELFEQAKKEVPCALIKDAGLTQIAPGTITCVVLGPWDEKLVDKYSGKLRLY
ncbi:MAG: peptidyl-tRNA hydrolase Pth2 [Candidatus Micrarchaeota archaeon]